MNEEILTMLSDARLVISRMKLSMLVHPDCTDGSEFDDRTTEAQEVEDRLNSLIKNHTS